MRMRMLWGFVLCGACYDAGTVAPCTLTCESASCPGDLVCGSDFVCQEPGMPSCSTTIRGEPFYVKAPNVQEGDAFGSSISLSADGVWLAVGAPHEDSGSSGIDGNHFDNSKPEAGAAYIFQWDGTGYVPATYVKSPSPDMFDLFGTSVAISAGGNLIAIGAPREDGNGTGITGDPANNQVIDSGAVFIYQRTGPAAPWVLTRYVKAPSPVVSGFFGESVALSADGSYLAVGQPGNADAYRYRLTPSVSLLSVSGSAIAIDDGVGRAVALSGDGETLFAGAPFEDGPGKELGGDPSLDTSQDAGAVFMVFANGAQQAYCKASNTEPGDLFGSSVAASVDAGVFVVGAPDEDGGVIGNDGNDGDNSAPGAGAVYLYKRASAEAWFFSSYMKASNTGHSDNFGASIAITPDASNLVVGAPGESSAVAGDPQDDAAPRAGAAYVFSMAQTDWQLRAYLKAPNADSDDRFGSSVAISDDHAVIAVGAPGEASSFAPDDNTAKDAGAVYVFR